MQACAVILQICNWIDYRVPRQVSVRVQIPKSLKIQQHFEQSKLRLLFKLEIFLFFYAWFSYLLVMIL